MATALKTKRYLTEEQERVIQNLPLLRKLLDTKKIEMKEKIRVIEDINVDIKAYLLSIGEEV